MNMHPPIFPHYGDEGENMADTYAELVSLIGRLHRQLLEVIRHEFQQAGVHDINPVQGLLLFNIGKNTVSVGELTSRGYYHGSNVSHNLKKLIQIGYINRQRSIADARSVRVCLSEKGMDIHFIIGSALQRHASELGESDWLKAAGLERLTRNLHIMERYWGEQLRVVF